MLMYNTSLHVFHFDPFSGTALMQLFAFQHVTLFSSLTVIQSYNLLNNITIDERFLAKQTNKTNHQSWRTKNVRKNWKHVNKVSSKSSENILFMQVCIIYIHSMYPVYQSVIVESFNESEKSRKYFKKVKKKSKQTKWTNKKIVLLSV